MRMNQSFTQNITVLCIVAFFATMAACGKKSSDKNDSNDTSSATTEIGTSEIDDSGKATVTYTSTASGTDFLCQVVTKDGAGEWYSCPEGTTSYELKKGESVTIKVKKGDNGTVVEKALTYVGETEIKKDDYLNHQQNHKTFGNEQGIALSTNRYIQAPEGMRVIRYSDANGLSTEWINAYVLLDSGDETVSQFVPQISLCEAGAYQGAQANGRASVVTRSLHNKTAYQYCKYSARPGVFKEWNNFAVGVNQIEFSTEPSKEKTQPLEYLSVAVFQNRKDADSTRRRFTDLCGIPNGTMPDYQRTGDNYPYGGTSQQFQKHNNGYVEGGTIFNLPLTQTFWSAQLPKNADFHWCEIDRNIDGITKTFFVGSYEINRPGMMTADKLEFHYIVEKTRGRYWDFARQAQQQSLNAIRPSMPLGN